MTAFMFATGIENSYPTIALPDGRTERVDEMARTKHYQRWKEDFALVKQLGIPALRYGPPYYKAHLGPGRYDWSFADETFAELKRLEICPIADLCHFGVPDWAGSFQNPDWPHYFAEYAEAFARRFPWVRHYTPVNEIFCCATFSAQFGWWNERLASDQAFVTALRHMCQANVLAMGAIIGARADATFIQSETSTYYHAEDPSCVRQAAFLNEKRFLALDFTYGYPIAAPMYEYVMDHGMTREDYHWFREHHVKAHCVMGTDYYEANEQVVRGDGTLGHAGEIFGYYVLTHQYFGRYRLPVMHTETNFHEPGAEEWLFKEWTNMVRLKEDGVPIIGFTWYSLTDQVDWDTALRENNGRVNPLGLCDLDRKLRPVGRAYQELIKQWQEILPTGSLVLTLGY